MVKLPAQVAWLGRAVGEPSRDLVVAGEGNVSGVDDAGRLWVSASGTRLAELDEADVVGVDPDALLARLDDDLDDAAWLEVVMASQLDRADRRPTVEVGLHAVLAAEHGSPCFVAHAHPTALLSLLCSAIDLEVYAEQRLFPDHVVMLGTADCVLDYIDPGRALAAQLRRAVATHRQRHHEMPSLVLARNHGAFTVGSSPQQALERLEMATKIARVTLGVPGALQALPPAQVARIAGREDEHYRQELLR